MREEVHLHAEGDSFRALDAVARRNGMSRSRLALGLVWEAWRRDIEGLEPRRELWEPGTQLEAVMVAAVRGQAQALVHRLHVVESPYDADLPVTVASSLVRVIEATAREA